MKTYEIYVSPTHNTKVVILVFNEDQSFSHTEVFRYYPLLNEILTDQFKKKTRQQQQSKRLYVKNNYEFIRSIKAEGFFIESEECFNVVKAVLRERHLYGSYIK